MSTLLQDLGEFLTNQGLVQGEGVDFFRNFMPDTPNFVIVPYEYGGPPPPSFTSAVDRSIQLQVRSNPEDPDPANQRAWDIFNKLCPADPYTGNYIVVTPERWGLIKAHNVPRILRRDESNRITFYFEFTITTTRD